MNEIDRLSQEVIRRVCSAMDGAAEQMAKSMESRLKAGDHINTGRLINGIKPIPAKASGNQVNAYIDVTAENPENGAWYPEFLEFGTGVYNERGNGRQTPWSWTGEDPKWGGWHTTQGMQPDPFIRPSVAEHIGELEEKIGEAVSIETNLERYKV